MLKLPPVREDASISLATIGKDHRTCLKGIQQSRDGKRHYPPARMKRQSWCRGVSQSAQMSPSTSTTGTWFLGWALGGTSFETAEAEGLVRAMDEGQVSIYSKNGDISAVLEGDFGGCGTGVRATVLAVTGFAGAPRV